MKLYDNSTLSTLKTCPRRFYLNHIKKWGPESPNVDLVTGQAWHNALDVVWESFQLESTTASLSRERVVIQAWEAFCDTWNESFPVVRDLSDLSELGPKNPLRARELLSEYYDQRKEFLRGIDILAIELPFAVPVPFIGQDVYYTGKLDKVFLTKEGQLIVGEHKTTSWYSKKGGFRQEYLDSFSPNSQIQGYLFAASMLWPEEAKRAQVWVDITLFHKTDSHFKLLPISSLEGGLDDWLEELQSWVLQAQQAERGVRFAPRNAPAGCYSYFKRCPYYDMCRFWPTEMVEKKKEVPPGFKHNDWEPITEWEVKRALEVQRHRGEE